MDEREALERLERLMARHLRVPAGYKLRDDDELSRFAADWRIVDLGMVVEAEFGVPMSADKALSLKTAGEWRGSVDREIYRNPTDNLIYFSCRTDLVLGGAGRLCFFMA